MSDLRERAKEAAMGRKQPKVWEAPHWSEFAPNVRVVAFDQSLTHTGWVDFEVGSQGALIIYGRGTINITVSTKGHVSTMDKADDLLDALRDRHIPTYARIVGEMTPVVGYRLESSLLAGYVLRQAYRDVEFVSRQSALALLLPLDQRKAKKYSREVLNRYASVETASDRTMRWNEHQRDALMLGLTRLHQIAKEAS